MFNSFNFSIIFHRFSRLIILRNVHKSQLYCLFIFKSHVQLIVLMHINLTNWMCVLYEWAARTKKIKNTYWMLRMSEIISKYICKSVLYVFYCLYKRRHRVFFVYFKHVLDIKSGSLFCICWGETYIIGSSAISLPLKFTFNSKKLMHTT